MKPIHAVLFSLAACASVLPQTSSAQTYPAKPIRLIVGFAPGGAADIISRIIGDPLGRALGQSIIIDNKPGAASSVAVEFVSKSAPDGYTILIASQSGMIVNPLINPNVGYNTERDFAPISKVTVSPLVVTVNPTLPVHSVRELIAEAKKAPGKLNAASSGNGSLPHLAVALFSAQTGVQMVHVPYKSGGQAVQSVLAGDTQVTFATSPSVLPFVQAGRLRALAVTSSERTPLVQGLPGMKEAGLADYEVTVWYGFFAPTGTPAEVVRRLFEATALVLQNPNVQQALARDGTETSGSRTPADFGAFVSEETKLWTQVIRASGAKFD